VIVQRITFWVAVLLLVTLLGATAEAATRASGRTALSEVDGLVVKGRGPMTAYSRAQFGPAWADVNGNGCDTRDDILRRDLRQRTVRAGTHGCVVTSGRITDPYTGKLLHYVRGHSDVDIDHVVALGDAWQMGAAHWSAARREALANDPLNLLAVYDSANREKGDSDAASWLPPRKAFRCAYVATQVAVKLKYGLAATSSEREAMHRVLDACPRLPLPARGAIPAVTLVSTKPTISTGGVRVFATCAAAAAAGVTPIRRGSKLYNANRKLDGDGDGVACEDG
jgi:Protein of unknown function (DUF1524)/Excalibur calcium-binding domain